MSFLEALPSYQEASYKVNIREIDDAVDKN